MLIAEDERRLADAIARGMRREEMAVDLAPNIADSFPRRIHMRDGEIVGDERQ